MQTTNKILRWSEVFCSKQHSGILFLIGTQKQDILLQTETKQLIPSLICLKQVSCRESADTLSYGRYFYRKHPQKYNIVLKFLSEMK